MNNFYQNPMYPPTPTFMARQEIVRVNGENGARAFQMAPNSSAILLDENSPLVWVVQTDGAGYKTVSPYSIAPYQPEPPIDVRGLDERLKRLEEMFNGKSNSGSTRKKATDESAT